jgi:hypothetical protein
VSLSNGASSKLTTNEVWLSTWNFAARLTTSLPSFLADHFFRSEKKAPRTSLAHSNKYDYVFMSFIIKKGKSQMTPPFLQKIDISTPSSAIEQDFY